MNDYRRECDIGPVFTVFMQLLNTAKFTRNRTSFCCGMSGKLWLVWQGIADEIYSLWPREVRVGNEIFGEMKTALMPHEPPKETNPLFAGIPVRVDDTIPPTELHLRSFVWKDGKRELQTFRVIARPA